MTTTPPILGCSEARELMSAELDGELGTVGSLLLETHVQSCTICALRLREAHRVHRSLRLEAAQPVPDRTRQIMAVVAAAAEEQRATSRPPIVPMTRVGLLIVAIMAVGAAVPQLLHQGDVTATAHGARELGIFEITLAVGFLIAARTPVHARVVALLGSVISGGLVLTGALDIGFGHTAMGLEVHHTLAVVGTVLSCVIARAQPRGALPSRPPWSGKADGVTA